MVATASDDHYQAVWLQLGIAAMHQISGLVDKHATRSGGAGGAK